jgi:hypothetical protein
MTKVTKMVMEVGEKYSKLRPRVKRAQSWFEAAKETLIPLRDVFERIHKKYVRRRRPRGRMKQVLDEAESAYKFAVRSAKRAYFERMAVELKTHYDESDPKAYHKCLKSASLEKAAGASIVQVTDKQGVLQTELDSVIVVLTEHFDSLMGGNVDEHKAVDMGEVERAVDQLPVAERLDRAITAIELRHALMALQNGKSIGADEVPTELLKILLAETLNEKGYPVVNHTMVLMVKLMNSILDSGVVPQDLKDAVIVVLFKGKGLATDCDNYRGISLLSHVGKLLTKVTERRLGGHVEDIGFLPEAQCGFRKKRGTVDMLFVTRVLTEAAHNYNMPLASVFVDLKKAYDSVNRELMWWILKRIGVPPKLLAVIMGLHKGMRARMRVDGKVGEWFEVVLGLRQGCVIAPLLFNIFFACVVKLAEMLIAEGDVDGSVAGVPITHLESGHMWTRARSREGKKHLNLSSIWIALFADDAAMMTQRGQVELQRMMSAFHSACNVFGLTVSVPKTEVMARPESSISVQIDGKELKQVQSFKYLGAKATPDGKSEPEVKRRCGLAWVAFSRYMNWFKCRTLSYKHKITMYYTYVLTVLLYGCETWTTTASIFKRLESFNYKAMLFICNHFKREKFSYASMLKESKMDVTIEGLVRQRRLNWVGRMNDMSWARLPKRVLFGLLRERNDINGSPASFKTCVKRDLLKFGLLNNGLNEEVDLVHWQSLTDPSHKWKIRVFEKRTSVFMRDFYAREEVAHNNRILKKQILAPLGL